MTHIDAFLAQLDLDLQQVHARLHQSLQKLDGPLGELVRAQVQHIQPFARAATVLTTVYSTGYLTAAQTDTHAQNRRKHALALAAALEMLYLALSIHKRLIQAAPAQFNPDANTDSPQSDTRRNPGISPPETSPSNRVDKTFLGSTILAGDYCFSRASQLAAETENPRVIAHFAQTLQSVSEDLLRQEFQSSAAALPPANTEVRILIVSAAESALTLQQAHTQAHTQAYTDDTPTPDGAPNSAPEEPPQKALTDQTLQRASDFAEFILNPDNHPARDNNTNKGKPDHSQSTAPYWAALRAWWPGSP